MNKKCLYTVLLIVFILSSCTKIVQTDSVLDNRLSELLKNNDFFSLRSELPNVETRLSEDKLLYYKTMCEKSFGNEQLSNEYAALFLKKYGKQQSDTIKAAVLDVMAHNYMMSHKYKDAVEVYDILLGQYNGVLDSATIIDYENNKKLFGAFVNVKPQIIHKKGDCIIASKRNQFNHLMIPVNHKNITDDFIFDTGANISTITDSCAMKMGLTIYNTDIKVGAAQGQIIQTKLAVADSLYVGDILFENVVFLVAPAETMSFPEFKIEIHGIIGFPVFRQMGEVHLHKNDTIFVPEIPQNKRLNNMFFDNLNPIVQLISDKDTLLFFFDTGATNSSLFEKYYKNHKSEVEQKGILKKAKKGSAGGIIEVERYEMTDFPYRIGTKNGILSTISVALEQYGYHESYDGDIGQDIITQFNTLILNFKDMYVDFE